MKYPARYQTHTRRRSLPLVASPDVSNFSRMRTLTNRMESDTESPVIPGMVRALTSSKATHDFSGKPTPIVSVNALEGQRRYQPIPLAKNTLEPLADDDDVLDSTDIDVLRG